MKIYAITLAVGLLALLVVILGGSFAENVGRPDRDPGERIGLRGKMVIAALMGFGMGGMSAEFSPLDLTWQVALAAAIGAAFLSVVWVRYAVAQAQG